jgi:hypothetical protein
MKALQHEQRAELQICSTFYANLFDNDIKFLFFILIFAKPITAW